MHLGNSIFYDLDLAYRHKKKDIQLSIKSIDISDIEGRIISLRSRGIHFVVYLETYAYLQSYALGQNHSK